MSDLYGATYTLEFTAALLRTVPNEVANGLHISSPAFPQLDSHHLQPVIGLWR